VRRGRWSCCYWHTPPLFCCTTTNS
jgi:hypothetical protein